MTITTFQDDRFANLGQHQRARHDEPALGQQHQRAHHDEPARRGLFEGYRGLPGTFDEWFGPSAAERPKLGNALSALCDISPVAFGQMQSLAERCLLEQGVTFSVYADQRGTEKIFPFCLMPRVISAPDWSILERGLAQRVTALGAFLSDVYGKARIFAAMPDLRDMVCGAKQYDARLSAFSPPGGVRIHISGIDLVRDAHGQFLVLEDNLRTPSGVSYVVENRLTSRRILPRVMDGARIRRVDEYPAKLAESLRATAPADAGGDPYVVVLTPGRYNSAYFEHAFLARTMGFELVEPADLFVDDDQVYVRTTHGPRRVHVIYRRVDDAFLDPEYFRPDSLLGVRGLMRAYAAGKVALANAPGNGIADDKAVYPFVPQIIRFYLGEEPIIDQVPTYVCARPDDRRYVSEHLEQLVVKAVDEAGGYGMLMGPQSTAAEREEFRRRIEAEPRKYIAQPRIELSTCPTWDPKRGQLVPRRVDLRPYTLSRPDGCWTLPGGLTRVALREGSYVVNSSQGGGSKDTWVQKELQ